jgi:hypothetical protein
MEALPTFLRLAWRSGLCPAGLFFMLLGGIFASLGGVRLSEELRYRRDGVRVRGTVVSKSIESASSNQSSTRYLVAYRFATTQGAATEGSDEVSVDRWEELRQGDPFEIVYRPDSPAANRATTTTEMPLAVAFTATGAFVLLVGGGVLLIGARTVSRQLTPAGQAGARGFEGRS